MRRLIVALAGLLLLVPPNLALARGNHRFAIDQQWKRVQAWQEKQDKRFKAIEVQADGLIRKIPGKTGPEGLNHRGDF
jgi:hypothetical protein